MKTAIERVTKPFSGIHLVNVSRLGQQITVPQNTLLHAGPPYESLESVPEPVKIAACQILILDGLSQTLDQARELIDSGQFRFSPAQDHNVVTPLAQVVSASSWVVQASDGRNTGYGALVEGPAPALRFGSGDPACLDAMRALDGVASLLQAELSRQPIDLRPIIEAGLLNGDECHAVTQATHSQLLRSLPALEDCLAGKPWFVLPIVMAACSVALKRHGLLRAVGGNGVTFGWKPAGRSQWKTTAAVAPAGQRFIAQSESTALPAIGDSAVVDFAGLGAQALEYSPEMQEVWATHLPGTTPAPRCEIIDQTTGLVCPKRISETGQSPAVHLAMVHSHDSGKILGRGAYIPPVNLFESAPEAMNQELAR